MNSVVVPSRPAELNRDSIAQSVTRFHDDVRADSISFAGNVFARHMAVPGVIASERAHDGR